MKVILTKKAEYEFNKEKFTEIPSAVFEQLVNSEINGAFAYEKLDEVVMFDNRDDYNMRRSEFEFSDDASVFVNGKGQIFRFLKKEEVGSDGSAAAEENS